MKRPTRTTADEVHANTLLEDRVPTEDLELYADAATKIDPLNLRDEYIKLPADMARWNARLAEAMERRAEAEVAFDRVVARLSRAHRAHLEAESRKPTEGAIKERLHDDQKYVDARMAVIEAEADEARTKGVVRAVEAKRDMLISLGAHVRKEMEHSPATRTAQRDQHTDAGGGHDWNT